MPLTRCAVRLRRLRACPSPPSRFKSDALGGLSICGTYSRSPASVLLTSGATWTGGQVINDKKLRGSRSSSKANPTWWLMQSAIKAMFFLAKGGECPGCGFAHRVDSASS